MLKKLFAKSLIYFFLLAVGKVLTAVFFIFLARLLHPEKFGLITFFITVVQIGATLGDMGLKSWYQKTAANHPEPTLLAQMATWRSLWWWVSVIVLGVIQWWTKWLPTPLFPFVVAALAGEALLSIADAYYLSRGESLRLGIKLIARNALLFAGLPLISGGDWTMFLWIYDISLLLVAFGYFPYQAIKKPSQIATPRGNWAYAAIDDVGVIYGRADQLLMETLVGSYALGIYGAAYRYIDAFNLLPQAIFHNLFPVAAKSGAISKRQLCQMSAIMTGCGLVVGAGVYLASDFLTIGLLGSDYATAGQVLRRLSIVVVLFFANSVPNAILQSSGRVRTYAWLLAGVTIINIIANWWLLPRSGVLGAPLAMLIGEGLLTLINWWQLGKIYHHR